MALPMLWPKRFKTDESALVRLAAAKSLGRMQKAAQKQGHRLGSCTEKTIATEKRSRAAAAEAIGLIEADPNDVLDALIQALRDESAKVRLDAVASINRFGKKCRFGPLMNWPCWSPTTSRLMFAKKAAETLASLGAQAAPAVDRLANALRDSSTMVRRMAALALSEIGPKARPRAQGA
ncbi:MAG: hypothetical protein KatS3mg105_0321 [Gemmatales bacterium]|nr:MAG: hypothetical protein KatS3mg105_0321 [Gemmatales bacterium]